MFKIEAFFHKSSATISYLVYDSNSLDAIVIDSVLDFDLASGVISTEFADRQIEFINQLGLKVGWILETHAHADHLSSAYYLKSQVGGKTAIGEGIKKVQQTFKTKFNISDHELVADGSAFDHLLRDQENFQFGSTTCTVIATPGHTSDSLSYKIGNNVFVGDTLFLPDVGSARCDFPGGNAQTLYDSVHKLYQLPDDTVLWMCHDYPESNRKVSFSTTVKESKERNIHLPLENSLENFVQLRKTRDKSLAVPKLLYPAIQVNIRAGRFPLAEENQETYLKIPITLDKFTDRGRNND
ncbi:MBL fold metallo-hydrolase [Catenovulum maritimum]|uniref:Beta-lactamase n=1 Tax=Catenovulum maritimum TaxID=1513271 RepID=A0A0J8GWM5_9ALTE|nr:MBL fold metallo-hydrolase [Catenovulum maritimum]KMT65694.1 beta-lactamase [Catenovulum maritimum]